MKIGLSFFMSGIGCSSMALQRLVDQFVMSENNPADCGLPPLKPLHCEETHPLMGIGAMPRRVAPGQGGSSDCK